MFSYEASQYFLAPSQNNKRGALSTKIRPADTSRHNNKITQIVWTWLTRFLIGRADTLGEMFSRLKIPCYFLMLMAVNIWFRSIFQQALSVEWVNVLVSVITFTFSTFNWYRSLLDKVVSKHNLPVSYELYLYLSAYHVPPPAQYLLDVT